MTLCPRNFQHVTGRKGEKLLAHERASAGAVRAKLFEQMETERNQLVAQVEDLKKHLGEEAKQRALLQDNLKRVFMRGVCALNFEAMSLLNDPQGGTATMNAAALAGATEVLAAQTEPPGPPVLPEQQDAAWEQRVWAKGYGPWGLGRRGFAACLACDNVDRGEDTFVTASAYSSPKITRGPKPVIQADPASESEKRARLQEFVKDWNCLSLAFKQRCVELIALKFGVYLCQLRLLRC
eukprot:s804_g11.t1